MLNSENDKLKMDIREVKSFPFIITKSSELENENKWRNH